MKHSDKNLIKNTFYKSQPIKLTLFNQKDEKVASILKSLHRPKLSSEVSMKPQTSVSTGITLEGTHKNLSLRLFRLKGRITELKDQTRENRLDVLSGHINKGSLSFGYDYMKNDQEFQVKKLGEIYGDSKFIQTSIVTDVQDDNFRNSKKLEIKDKLKNKVLKGKHIKPKIDSNIHLTSQEEDEEKIIFLSNESQKALDKICMGLTFSNGVRTSPYSDYLTTEDSEKAHEIKKRKNSSKNHNKNYKLISNTQITQTSEISKTSTHKNVFNLKQERKFSSLKSNRSCSNNKIDVVKEQVKVPPISLDLCEKRLQTQTQLQTHTQNDDMLKSKSSLTFYSNGKDSIRSNSEKRFNLNFKNLKTEAHNYVKTEGFQSKRIANSDLNKNFTAKTNSGDSHRRSIRILNKNKNFDDYLHIYRKKKNEVKSEDQLNKEYAIEYKKMCFRIEKQTKSKNYLC